MTVANRAGQRCEYCLLTSQFQVGGFELDHIQPRSRGGVTSPDNTAFACPHCNCRKSDHIEGPDPLTRAVVGLFNPRQQFWHDHFQWSVDLPFVLVGKSPTGRATIQRLVLNDPQLLRLRTLLAEIGSDCRKADFE